MIILVQASIILVTRMISKKQNMILRAQLGGNFHHPIIILVGRGWLVDVGLSIFGRGGRVGTATPTLTAVRVRIILTSSYPNGRANVQNSAILLPSYLLGSRSPPPKKILWSLLDFLKEPLG